MDGSSRIRALVSQHEHIFPIPIIQSAQLESQRMNVCTKASVCTLGVAVGHRRRGSFDPQQQARVEIHVQFLDSFDATKACARPNKHPIACEVCVTRSLFSTTSSMILVTRPKHLRCCEAEENLMGLSDITTNPPRAWEAICVVIEPSHDRVKCSESSTSCYIRSKTSSAVVQPASRCRYSPMQRQRGWRRRMTDRAPCICRRCRIMQRVSPRWNPK